MTNHADTTTNAFGRTPTYKLAPQLEVSTCHYDAIYASLINGRRFSRPVPLDFVTQVLVGSAFVGNCGKGVGNGRFSLGVYR